MKELNKQIEWEEDFDKHFQGFMSLGDPGGGYDPRPYIKNFIDALITQREQEAYTKARTEFSIETVDSSELHSFLADRNCPIVGCYYGHGLNDYCVCCGVKRPMTHNYGDNPLTSLKD